MTAAETQIPLETLRASPIKLRRVVPNDQLKIALLGYRSHPHVGGQGIYLKYLSRALSKLGHEVHVYSGQPYPELDANITLNKVPSMDLFEHKNPLRALKAKDLKSYTNVYEWFGKLTGGFAEPLTFGRRIVKQLSDNEYDIIHDNQSLCYGLLKLQAQGKTVVSTVHHPIHRDRELALQAAKKWGDRQLIKRWYSFLAMQQKVVAKLNHVITVSKTSQRDIGTYFKRPADKTPVIVNGIDTETFKPQPDIARKPYRLITTSSSDQPLKGLNFLLDAVAELRQDYPDIHLQVIGKLKKGGATETRLKEHKLEQHVSFKSGISTPQLVDQYAEASIAVCPSLYEGFGLPAGEAMACALPLISSDGGALPEVVGDAGLIVPGANSHALALQIRYLFEHPTEAKNLGTRARQSIVENFSWDRVAEQLSAYYRDILVHANH